MIKALVTGGAGFIGSHLVDRLLKDDYEVTVLDNFQTGREENLGQHLKNKRLKILRMDLNDDLTDIFYLGKFNLVFHLAAVPRVQFSIKEPKTAHIANVDGTFNLLMVANTFNVERFIFSSSSSVYGEQDKLPLVETMLPNPVSPYALQKQIAEQYCRLFTKVYNVPTICLRYFNVYGPRQNPSGDYANLIPGFFEGFLRGKLPIINGDGEQTRDYTFVSDVVEANLLAVRAAKECDGEVFNIGGGSNVPINLVVEKIKALCKSQAKVSHGPAVLEPRHTLANSTKAKKLLGWRPKVTLDAGLAKEYEYFVKNTT